VKRKEERSREENQLFSFLRHKHKAQKQSCVRYVLFFFFFDLFDGSGWKGDEGGEREGGRASHPRDSQTPRSQLSEKSKRLFVGRMLRCSSAIDETQQRRKKRDEGEKKKTRVTQGGWNLTMDINRERHKLVEGETRAERRYADLSTYITIN
jgi:hypothetical protein